MKFKLLNRTLYGDHDNWVAKKKHYRAEISTPFRSNHNNYGRYSFVIKTPYGTVLNTQKTKLDFTNLIECIEFVIKWIDDDIAKRKSMDDSER